ncbi:MAG: sigma-70 family RNA polymerase sigma factor [Bacteroidota bacterium]
MSADRERHLILHAKEGDHEAFRELMELHMRQVYDLAYGFVNDHDDAEDITQEVFVKVFHSIKSFRHDAEFSTWLYRIITNTSLDRLKQRKRKLNRQVPLTELETMQFATNPGSIENLDLTGHIEWALHELPTLQ